MEKILITGVSGEVGYTLVKKLKALYPNSKITATDIKEPSSDISPLLQEFVKGDITNKDEVDKIVLDGNFDTIFHLASILSTGGEKNPELAFNVNIDGTMNLLESATESSLKKGRPVIFMFPSSIAAHGEPLTSYGIAKKSCEKIGVYFSKYYKLLDTTINRNNLIDFRGIRFPGLLSPDTLPTGGTSDYGPEMLHAAAQGKDYECFVRADSTIPFMAMDDAVDILIKLASTEKAKLTRSVYEVSGFSVSAKDIETKVKEFFPSVNVTYKIDEARQRIVDSWPKEVGSEAAIVDWGYSIQFDFNKAFTEYLIPKIKNRYSSSKV